MEDNTEIIKIITEIINEQGKIYNSLMTGEQIKNLTYAINKIEYKSHQDLAFIIYIASSTNQCIGLSPSRKFIVDEYLRRKRGQKSRIKDHAYLNLVDMGFPDTQRLFIYREQLNALLGDLSCGNGERLRKDIASRKVSADDFYKRLDKETRKNLADDDIRCIFEIISMYIYSSLPYYFCSTLANRVENRLKILNADNKLNCSGEY